MSIAVAPAASVWFIDNSPDAVANSANLGTQDDPFTSIAAFNAAQGLPDGPDAGDFIYLRDGTYTEADGINLANGQTLIGQGQNLVVNGVIIETGSAGQTPNIVVDDGANGANDGIDLAQNNTISGLNVSTTAGTGKGIDDNGNVGTLNISDISVSTASGTGIEVISGGTVTVTGDGNTINSTSATALNVANTTIGSAGLTFQSISAGNNTAAVEDNPTNGIVLNNTGSSGGLTVTGDNSGTANGSGGTITGSTGAGISLTSTRDVVLDQMNIQNGGNDGISALNVTNFTLTDSNVTGNGNADEERGIDFSNVTGNIVIDSTIVRDSFEDNFKLTNTSGTIDTLNIKDSTFDHTSIPAPPAGGSGVLIALQGTAVLTDGSISNSTFRNNFDRGIMVNTENTSRIGDDNATSVDQRLRGLGQHVRRQQHRDPVRRVPFVRHDRRHPEQHHHQR